MGKFFRRIEPAEFLIAFSAGIITGVTFAAWLFKQYFADNHQADAGKKTNSISENHGFNLPTASVMLFSLLAVYFFMEIDYKESSKI